MSTRSDFVADLDIAARIWTVTSRLNEISAEATAALTAGEDAAAVLERTIGLLDFTVAELDENGAVL